MLNLMSIRMAAAKVVALRVSLGALEEEAVEEAVDNLYMATIEIVAKKKELMAQLSLGRGKYQEVTNG